ncbi:hypothetical protein GGX14DRAFT_390424 [Mycena pura]|uniref:Uncharacterized protein n=1 Tax=Mycena pura TaxID=153505 RepID=A0AAD6YFL9_9AGAR|nr:hypothetical protein GGX14DRAFT_390424 [Mycena pura]
MPRRLSPGGARGHRWPTPGRVLAALSLVTGARWWQEQFPVEILMKSTRNPRVTNQGMVRKLSPMVMAELVPRIIGPSQSMNGTGLRARILRNIQATTTSETKTYKMLERGPETE